MSDKVLFTRKYCNRATGGGYVFKREMVGDSVFGSDDSFEMVRAYTLAGLYIGEPKWARKLVFELGLTQLQSRRPEGNVCQIGFSEAKQEWYGWSHRAIYHFGIGDTVEPGHCGYTAATPEELFRDLTTEDSDGWAWMKPEQLELLESGVRVTSRAIMVHAVAHDAENLQMLVEATSDGDVGEPMVAIEPDEEHRVWDMPCGRGTWTAETLEDAKQMAMDFAEGVS